MSDFQRLTLPEAAARIRGDVDSLVIFHRHPDGDAVGSGFALRLLLEAMGCRVLCACEDELPERLRFLVSDGQESIRYQNLPASYAPRQIISVDTASPAQVGVPFSHLEGRIDLMIDHHEKGEMYADGWIVGGCSSTGEMIYDLSRELLRRGCIRAIPGGVDRLLYAAVSSDTGCFRYSNASPKTLRCAADLLGAGFDAAEINHMLFEVKSREVLAAEKIAYDRLKLFAGGRIGVVDMPMSVKRAYGLSDEHLETMVDVPRGLAGVQVAVAVRQPTDDGVYRVSMRSSCDVDVSGVCASFGGGGHARAAGCTIVTEDGMDAVVNMVAEAIEQRFR